MSLSQLLSSLRRNKFMALLLAIEVAFACAVVTNALFLLQNKLAPMLLSDGVAADEVVLVNGLINFGGFPKTQIDGASRALQQIPGVRAVSVGGLPYDGKFQFRSRLRPEQDDGDAIEGSFYLHHNLVQALGLEVIEGRDFLPEERIDLPFGKIGGDEMSGRSALITRGLADRLFGEGQGLGRSVRTGASESGSATKVVGILADFIRPEPTDAAVAQYTMVLPLRLVDVPILGFALRIDPAQRDAVIKAVPAALEAQLQSQAGFDLEVQPFDEVRDAYFQTSRALVWLLLTVAGVVVAITATGIAGLTGFWVQQRQRQIGIRRALGARRRDILRLFQAENLVIVLVGSCCGLALAWGINLLLMQRYELPRLPWVYLPLGAAVLFVLGQLAILLPAIRATRVPPATATRNA